MSSATYTAEEWRALAARSPKPEGGALYHIPATPEVIAAFMDGEFVRPDGVHVRMTHVSIDPTDHTLTPVFSTGVASS